jgi:cysteine synthase A
MAKKEGLLLGGSTGAITAAAISYLNKSDSEKEILLINPDRGDRYLETIYNPEWLSKENIRIISGENLEAAIDAINPISRSFYEVDNV